MSLERQKSKPRLKVKRRTLSQIVKAASRPPKRKRPALADPTAPAPKRALRKRKKK